MNELAKIAELLKALDNWADSGVTHITSSWLTSAMNVITCLGSSWVALLFLIGISILLYKQRVLSPGSAMLLIFGLGEGCVQILKLAFHRARPASITVCTFGASFPSGHSFTSAVVFGFIIYLLWHRRVRYSRAWAVLFGFLILLVGFSRIYLHAHFLTDVVGGYLFGLVWLIFGIHLFRIKS
jgi:membrane-associated phospholipid phosphatase